MSEPEKEAAPKTKPEPTPEQNPKPAPKTPEPTPKLKLWTPKRIFIIFAALFIAIGLFLQVRHLASPLAGVILLIGIIIAIVILTRPNYN